MAARQAPDRHAAAVAGARHGAETIDVHVEAIDHRGADFAQRIRALTVLAFAQEAQLIGVGSTPAQLPHADGAASVPAYCLGAFRGIDLVGAIVLTADDEPGQISIASLVVHPDHQRVGIATALLAQAFERGKGTAFSVCATAKNAPALALYRGLGFVEYRRGHIGPDALPLVKLRRAAYATV